MAVKNFNSRTKQKRDTSANWESNNPVILNGEIVLVDTNTGELRAKVGDGTKPYNQLPFSDEALRTLIAEKTPTAVSSIMAAATWNTTSKTYSFETTYPFASYDLSIEPYDACTTEQFNAWADAQIVGSATTNAVKAYGVLPKVDIPIIIKVVSK